MTVERHTTRFGFDLLVAETPGAAAAPAPDDGRSAVLLRQFAKAATLFVNIGADRGFFSVLAGLAEPGCRAVSFVASADQAALVEDNLRRGHVTADVRVLADLAALDIEATVAMAADEVLLVRVDWPGCETAVLERLRTALARHDDVRLFVEFTPAAPETPGPEIDALLTALIDLELDAFLLGTGEEGHTRTGKPELLAAFASGYASAALCCLPKSRSLHLCAFSHSSELGGAELCLAELVDQMTSRFGTLFTVVLPSDGPLRERLEGMGASTMVVESPWWCADPALPAFAATEDDLAIGFLHLRRALPELERRSPDAVLTSTVTIPWGAAAAAGLERPHVWWVHEYGRRDHGFEFLYGYEESLRVILEASNHVVATSAPVRKELFPDAPDEKCSVASYTPFVRAVGCEVPSAFGRPGATRLVHTGRVVPTKGQEDIVRAVAALVEAGRDVELAVVGAMDPDSDYGSMLLHLVEQSEIADRVRFLGLLPDVVPVIQEAHISITCSRCEAYGRVTAEALLLETPVIGTDTGGTAELIDDGVDGFLYPPGDVAGLAERIAFFVDHPDEIAAFGTRAKSNMIRRIETSRVDTRFFEVCLEQKGGACPRSAALAQLSQGWQERTEGALERGLLEREALVRDLEQRAQDLQGEFAERTEWAFALQREIAEMRSTFTWRVHRALKDPKRAWNTIRGRL